MRLMSFTLTTAQIMNRSKTVTRRLGWRDLKLGQRVLAVEKCMGLAKGEHPKALAVLRVADVRREPLEAICRAGRYRTALGDRGEVWREGFAMSDHEFVAMFCDAMRCTAETEVTRIEFQYVPGGRFAVPGFCRGCGCTEDAACWDDADGPCWWVDDRGRTSLDQTTLCSHCFKQQPQSKGIECSC